MPWPRVRSCTSWDGDDDFACILDLKYNTSDHTFRAVDNGHCGGFNVSFNGKWRRRAVKAPAAK